MNMDLEIVYNCINSSLKPSQPYMNKPFSPMPANSPESKSRKKCQFSSDVDCNNCECTIHTSSSNICTISNCAIPEHNSASSPVIFDVGDSENDSDDLANNESTEIPLNCSQKSISKESNLDMKELDLYSTESNSSQDSVKFLQSSFAYLNDFYKTSEKEENSFNSALPKISKLVSPCARESPSALSDVSRDSPKLVGLSCSRRADASGSSDFHSDMYINFESSISLQCESPQSKYIKNIQTDGIKITEISIVDSPDRDSSVNQTSALKIETTQRVTPLSLNSHESITVHSLIPDANVTGGDQIDLLSMKSFPDNQNSVLSTPEKSKHVEHASPEVLICYSDSDSKSQVSITCETATSSNRAIDFPHTQMKSSLFSAEATSPNFSFLSFEERINSLKNAAKNQDKFRLQSSSIANTPSNNHNGVFPLKRKVKSPDEHGMLILDARSSLHNEKNESEETFLSANKPTMEVVPNMQDFPRSSQTSYEPIDDPVFKPYVLSPPKPFVTELNSSRYTQYIKDNHTNKAVTPSNKPESINLRFQLTDSPVTPFPDYKNMVTPEIKQALRQIGVKALPRRKAVALLSHVYNETHPLLNVKTHVGSSQRKASKEEKVAKSKKRKDLIENVVKPAKRQQKEVLCPEVNSATQDSDESSSENPEWQGCVPEITFTQFNEDSPTKTNKDDIELIKQYIQSNEELYNTILTYMPLNMVAFHQELKDNGIKISIQKLMDFLDEQCITFTCPRKEEYRKKQTFRTQRFRKNMIAKLSQQAS